MKNTNSISGGLGLAHIRLLAGYDRILPLGFTIGGRVGYSFLGSPSATPKPSGGHGAVPNSYLPFHGEVRGGWMLAKDGLSKGNIRPHVFIGGGVAQVNASVPLTVCDKSGLYDKEHAHPCDPTNAAQGDKVAVNAYQVTGQGFVDFGAGATYMIINNFGIQAEVKFMVMIPTTGFVIAPVIAPMVAF